MDLIDWKLHLKCNVSKLFGFTGHWISGSVRLIAQKQFVDKVLQGGLVWVVGVGCWRGSLAWVLVGGGVGVGVGCEC